MPEYKKNVRIIRPIRLKRTIKEMEKINGPINGKSHFFSVRPK